MRLLIHKILHWEYWPFQLVYFPVFIVWPFLAIRARSLFFFSTVNPGMKNGGLVMNSKKEIYDLIPQQYYPKTYRIDLNTPFEEVLQAVAHSVIDFPFYVKPDIGLRGMSVKKIYSEEELKHYHGQATYAYLLQNTIPYTNEIGIFYVRYPNEATGKITGIVGKEFLIVTGDGSATIEALLKQDKRYHLQLKTLQNDFGDALQNVLAKEEQLNLVPYGNHCRGTKFIDESAKISPELTKAINKVCNAIDGFYYGRMDVLFDSWEALEKGEGFSIVELNGAISEPTHIYDPRHSIWFAWKTVLQHFYMMSAIARQNKKNGAVNLTANQAAKTFRQHFKHIELLEG